MSLKINKLLFIIFLFSTISSCVEKECKVVSKPKVIEIDINRTIETFMILRSLADNDPHFKYRKPDFKANPLVYFSRQFFQNQKGDKAVYETQKLINEFGVDIVIQGLLYAKELPNIELIHNINSPDWKGNEQKLISYLTVLKDFYVNNNVSSFIKQNQHFYAGAIKEAQSYIDKRLLEVMEDYFGAENDSYKVILAPNQPFGMGFGADVENKRGKTLYQILAPANKIDFKEGIEDYKEFGFSGENASEYYRDLVAHEFCHSFITPIIEKEPYKAAINKTDSLFVPKLNLLMTEQGYDNWWSFVNEHLVRLAEVRVSKQLGIKNLKEMRAYNVVDNGFILIPDAEKCIVEYEEHRNQYPRFELFLPKLIEQFSKYSKQDIENKLSILR